MSVASLEKRLKKQKKEIINNEKLQKEYITDLEIVYNDFIDTKYDDMTSNASRK